MINAGDEGQSTVLFDLEQDEDIYKLRKQPDTSKTLLLSVLACLCCPGGLLCNVVAVFISALASSYESSGRFSDAQSMQQIGKFLAIIGASLGGIVWCLCILAGIFFLIAPFFSFLKFAS